MFYETPVKMHLVKGGGDSFNDIGDLLWGGGRVGKSSP